MVRNSPFLQKNSHTSLSQLGINMVDLMMWLVIAALLLAAALQGIGFYQQAAHVYQAKSDTSAANTWVGARVAQDGAMPSLATLSAAVANGDLKLTKTGLKQNGVLMSVSGNDYCIGVSSPVVNGDRVFYVASTSPAEIIRAAAMPSTCGTAVSASVITPPASGGGSVATGPLPAVSSSSLRFGIASDLGTDTDATARLVNESPAIIAYYKDWTQSVDVSVLNGISGKGATPLITWEPWSYVVAGTNQPTYKLSTITAGTHDAYIRSWAADLKAYNKPVMIRFAHEMNGNWYPWSEQVNGNTPGDYVKAWKHVVDVFRAEGATNVKWVWAPNVQQPGVSTAALYPGSAYVDNTGVDGFNWGSDQPWTGGWQDPWDVLDSSMTEIAAIAPDKSLIVTETATVGDQSGHSKAKWITDMIYYLNHWGDSRAVKVTGIIWFDIDKEHDWRIASSTESAEAMKAALAAR